MSAKETEKWNKKQQKAFKKSQERSRKEEKKHPTPIIVESPTIPIHGIETPEKVALFFNDYVGKTIEFESVGIFELEAVRGTGDKIYGIDVSSGKESYSKYFGIANPLNFVMDDTLAREVTQEQEEWIKSFPSGRLRRRVNIYAEMRRGEYEAKIAYIRCIEFKTKSLGSCK
jgi:hypothetical protein